MFLEAGFGMRMQVVPDRDQFGLDGADGLQDFVSHDSLSALLGGACYSTVSPAASSGQGINSTLGRGPSQIVSIAAVNPSIG